MSAPTLTFAANHTSTDSAWGYNGTGDPEVGGTWKVITPGTDNLVFTGGGILGSLSTPTAASGTRDATIRPSSSSYIIPQTYVEKDVMYHAQFCGKNANRYTMGVYVDGTATSDIYIEAYDDNSFSTTALEILTGTAGSSNNSFINAIRTTGGAPSPTWSGGDTGAAYLRGETNRVALANASTVTDQAVYYNIYIELPTDCSTFHVQPVLAFRYLYT
jgi:hypothetical protein